MTENPAAFSRLASTKYLRFLLILPLILVSACAQTRTLSTDAKIERGADGLSVLLMPADVELSLLTASGLEEPHAEWTEQGRQNVIAALKEELAERRAEVVSYADDSDASYQIASEHEQLVKLHQAVGSAIMTHKYLPGFALPTKKDRFDWTLGDGVQALRDSRGVDYALFVHAQDSFSSGGRVAMNIVLALLPGAAPKGGQQVAFASLVDLNSGEVIWFNLLNRGAGDLRDPEQARQAMDLLLETSPL